MTGVLENSKYSFSLIAWLSSRPHNLPCISHLSKRQGISCTNPFGVYKKRTSNLANVLFRNALISDREAKLHRSFVTEASLQQRAVILRQITLTPWIKRSWDEWGNDWKSQEKSVNCLTTGRATKTAISNELDNSVYNATILSKSKLTEGSNKITRNCDWSFVIIITVLLLEQLLISSRVVRGRLIWMECHLDAFPKLGGGSSREFQTIGSSKTQYIGSQKVDEPIAFSGTNLGNW
jgi:hypothetical protein